MYAVLAELAMEHTAVGPHEPACAVFEAVYVAPFVAGAVVPNLFALTMLFVINPIPFLLYDNLDILKVIYVFCTIWMDVFTVAGCPTVVPVASKYDSIVNLYRMGLLVDITVGVDQAALSMG